MWGDNTPWKNQTAFYTYIRGCLRKAWVRHPVKLNKIKSCRIRVTKKMKNGNEREVWGCECEICHKVGAMSDYQVDHIIPAGSLNNSEDIASFVKNLLYVTENDLRILCKDCHGVITLAEKQGLTFEEAKCTKEAIRLANAKQDTKWLKSKGIVPGSNAKKRREQIIQQLRKEYE